MSFYLGSLLFTAIASLLLGVFVYIKGRNKAPNIALFLFSISVAVWCFGQFMGEKGASQQAVLFWTRLGIAGAVFIPATFVHFTLSLIDQLSLKRKLVYLTYLFAFIFLILDFTPLFVANVGPTLEFRYYPQAGLVYPLFVVFVLAGFFYAFFELFAAFRAVTGTRKNQLLYVLIASAIGFLGGITAFFPVWGINLPVISQATLPLYILIAVYAIVKHKLFNISLIVRKGLVYSTLTIMFAGFYVLAILFINYFLSNYVNFHPVLSILIVVFISVLLFQPLKDRVQNLVDKLFFKGKYLYQKRIDDLSVENQKLFRSLLQADKLAALGTISAGMAHEIKNPLASLKGMTQILDENLDDPNFIKRYQEIVGRQIERINNIVEKLLKYGTPKGLALSEIDIKETMLEELGLLENQLRKRNIKVDLKIASLPKVEADKEQLASVFMNLFLNALQAMPLGGILSIRGGLSAVDAIYLEVADTGAGISADKLDKIFDPFFSTKEGGVGMGLAVVYRIIKEHKGDIQVESLKDKGTKFSIWFPIKQEQ
ncbi:MAG: hypothetical protein HQ596_08710 [Candidatus Saganbacteria bacterium]|nr:hypothetical protein [Candidatus Saganbacteria bacterium]